MNFGRTEQRDTNLTACCKSTNLGLIYVNIHENKELA